MNTSWIGKRYHEVTFLGTHNSFAMTPPFHASVQNQYFSLTAQLEGGVDMLDIEIRCLTLEHKIVVCHGPSLVSGMTGYRDLTDVLEEIKRFVQSHPDRVITLYCNYEGNAASKMWVNDVVKKTFFQAGLHKYVWSYNDTFMDWPYLQDMILSKRNVMVFGLVGPQDFKTYQNYFCKHGRVQEAWRASTPEDLDVERLVLPPYDPTKLFLLNAYASPRSFKDWPYIFGGNPHTAAIVNKEKVGLLLEHISKTQFVNWVWIDFWTPEFLLSRP